MALDGRLDRLMPALSARERALFVLRSIQAGKYEPSAMRSTMPREQVTQFNQLICSFNACNIFLPMHIAIVQQQTEQLKLRAKGLIGLIEHGRHVWALAELVREDQREKAEDVIAGATVRMELPWDEQDHGDSWLNVTDDLTAEIRKSVLMLWRQVSAIDLVLDEVRLQLDGEDPLRPSIRTMLESARQNLASLYKALSCQESFDLPEPDDSLWLARKFFDDGYRLMGGR